MRLIPRDSYEIVMFDYNAVPYMYLQRWDRLEFHQRLNAPWNSIITFRLGWNDPYIDELMAIKDDHIMFIYRIDPITKYKQRVYEGIHSTTTLQSSKRGQIIINLYSQGFTALLNRRIIIPPAGLESLDVKTDVRTAMTILQSRCINGVDDPDRVMPTFQLGAIGDGDPGDIIEYSARYTNLLTACETIAESGGMRFGVYCPPEYHDPTALFLRAVRVWGTDRRINSSLTTDRMFFHYESGNMEIPILSLNYSEEKNVAYVGGQGIGANRRMLELEDTDATARHRWARKEAFTDARGGDNDQKLLTEGLAYLSKNTAKQTLTFNVRQVPGSLWPNNWGLGDIITAKYRDYLVEREIREVTVTVTGGSAAQQVELVEAEMEDLTGSIKNYLATYTGEYYDPDPYGPPPPYEVPGWDLKSDQEVLAVFSGDGYVYRTNNFNNPSSLGGPTWDAVDLGLEGWTVDAGTGNTVTTNFVVDAYSPKYIDGVGAVNGWITTGLYIYRVEDIFGTPIVTQQTSLPLTLAELPHVNIDASFAEEGFVLAVVHYNNETTGGTYALYTTDGGLNWNTTQITAHRETDSNYYHMPGLLVTSKGPGQAYTFAFSATGPRTAAAPRCYVTNDYGASWNVFETGFVLGSGLGAGLHIPWHDNDNANIMYYNNKTAITNPQGDQDQTLYRRNEDGSHEPANPTSSGRPVGTRTGRWGIGTSPHDRLKVALAGTRGPTSACYGVYTSLDGGDSWTERIAGCTWTRHIAVAGDEDAAIYTFGSNKNISVTENFFGTFDSRKGNLDLLPGNGEIIGLCGG